MNIVNKLFRVNGAPKKAGAPPIGGFEAA